MLTATRADVWSFDHTIALDGRPLCRWSLTEAHLPTLHLPAQMLLLGVLLARWDAEAQSAG